MERNTHLDINEALCGKPVFLAEGRAVLRLETTDPMRVDAEGLVHGGFAFGLADLAAMLAVNHPNVVLARAEVRFLKPVAVGDALEAEAVVTGLEGRKRVVEVSVRRNGEAVLSGTFTCAVLDAHVLAGASR